MEPILCGVGIVSAHDLFEARENGRPAWLPIMGVRQ